MISVASNEAMAFYSRFYKKDYLKSGDFEINIDSTLKREKDIESKFSTELIKKVIVY